MMHVCPGSPSLGRLYARIRGLLPSLALHRGTLQSCGTTKGCQIKAQRFVTLTHTLTMARRRTKAVLPPWSWPLYGTFYPRNTHIIQATPMVL